MTYLPQEAVEAAAEALWNEREFRDPTGDAPDGWCPPGHDVHQPPPREPFLWEQMVSEGKFDGDQKQTHDDARAILEAADPFIAAQERERLRGEIVTWLEQNRPGCQYDDTHVPAVEEAFDSLAPELVEEDRFERAVEAAARAPFDHAGSVSYWDALHPDEQAVKRGDARRMLNAALPYLQPAPTGGELREEVDRLERISTGEDPVTPMSPEFNAEHPWSGPADIAYCPEHGLHGERDHCFACGKPVQQIRMIPADDAQAAVAKLEEAADESTAYGDDFEVLAGEAQEILLRALAAGGEE